MLLSILSGCKKEYESIEQEDDRNIKEYKEKNNLILTDTAGIQYKIITPGTGSAISYTEKLPLIITCRSIDGKFSSTDTFAVGSTVSNPVENRYADFLGYLRPEGLRIGIKEILKRKGGQIRLILPSRLAFGRSGRGDIPGNASLDYTIRVLDTADLAAYDKVSINKYLDANSLTGFTKNTTTGLSYKISEPGTGSPITVDSTITVEYTGKLFNGVVFDQATAENAATFKLSDLIKGWQQTLPLLKQGGVIRIIVPSNLAYGLEGSINQYTGVHVIPSFSCLDFNIKITNVTN